MTQKDIVDILGADGAVAVERTRNEKMAAEQDALEKQRLEDARIQIVNQVNEHAKLANSGKSMSEKEIPPRIRNYDSRWGYTARYDTDMNALNQAAIFVILAEEDIIENSKMEAALRGLPPQKQGVRKKISEASAERDTSVRHHMAMYVGFSSADTRMG